MKELSSSYIIDSSECKDEVYGYEIHMGICSYGQKSEALFCINDKNGEVMSYKDGAVNKGGNVLGTYIHGIFDSVFFREYIVNLLREKKGVSFKKSKDYESLREKELDKLADIVRSSIDIESIYNAMGMKK
jgi:adenosylcobyric acid synthase